MADYSVTPLELLLASRQKHYVGLHIEQGVPVLDRDLNLLHDLVSATIREVVTRYIGNGTPAGADGFGIEALSAPGDQQNFRISAGTAGPGRCLVGGIEVGIPAQGKNYHDQADVLALTTPTGAQPDPRVDTVYLDVFLVEVDSQTDKDLGNAADVGVQTSVRLKPNWVVRVAEGVPVPPAPGGHAFHALATLTRPRGNPAITASMITDKRQRDLTVSDIERRLRRVETAPVTLSLAPVLVSLGEGWIVGVDGASKEPGVTQASGIMSVNLPGGYRIASLGVSGNKTGAGNLVVQLFRRALDVTNPDVIVSIQANSGHFKQTQDAPKTDISRVNNDTFCYFLAAFLKNAGAADQVQLNGIQITCLPP